MQTNCAFCRRELYRGHEPICPYFSGEYRVAKKSTGPASSHPPGVPDYPGLAAAVAAVPAILAQARGTADDLPCALLCAYAVLGYGLSVAVPHERLVYGACPDDAAGCAALEGLKDPKARTADAGALPWGIILPFVFDLIQRWLR